MGWEWGEGGGWAGEGRCLSGKQEVATAGELRRTGRPLRDLARRQGGRAGVPSGVDSSQSRVCGARSGCSPLDQPQARAKKPHAGGFASVTADPVWGWVALKERCPGNTKT